MSGDLILLQPSPHFLIKPTENELLEDTMFHLIFQTRTV